MAGVLEIFIMFMKTMFAGAGAIVAFLVFCGMVYVAAIVIKSALQTMLEISFEITEALTTKMDEVTTGLQEKRKNRKEKRKGKKKHE